MKPAIHLSSLGPILIVVEALDETGDPSSRNKLLSIMANQVKELPSNFRILLTSRPLDDISEALGNSPFVLFMDLNMVPKALIDRDVAAYISAQLSQIDNTFFDDSRIHMLTQRSEGLFQWAYVACELIKGTGKISDPKKQFLKLIESSSTGPLSKLDQLYDTVLRTIIPDEDEDGRSLFCSVMSQILAMFEPLSLQDLTSMRSNFPPGPTVDANDISLVVKHMGSLLSGTTNPSVPIRPLHSSFHDYLTDSSRSKDFYIDRTIHRNNLALATLQIMKTELRFNICQLETSYRLNSDIPDLAERTKQLISCPLSYSCRRWASHVQEATDSDVALAVKGFLSPHFLFWLEVLSLLKCVSIAAPSLSSILAWTPVSQPFI